MLRPPTKDLDNEDSEFIFLPEEEIKIAPKATLENYFLHVPAEVTEIPEVSNDMNFKSKLRDRPPKKTSQNEMALDTAVPTYEEYIEAVKNKTIAPIGTTPTA